MCQFHELVFSTEFITGNNPIFNLNWHWLFVEGTRAMLTSRLADKKGLIPIALDNKPSLAKQNQDILYILHLSVTLPGYPNKLELHATS